MATQPRHFHRLLAFLDPLLRGAPLVLEPHHRSAVRFQVGYDESHTREQFPEMTLHLGHHPPRRLPTGRLGLIAYNLGKPLAAAGTAEEDRELVADQLAAAAGEDWRQAGQARPVLLASAGRKPPDQATVREHGPTYRSAGDGVDGGGGCSEIRQPGGGGWRGVCGVQ